MQYQPTARGLTSLLKLVKNDVDNVVHKLQAMQGIYLRNSAGLFSAAEIEHLRYYLEAVSYKFYLADLSLEQLWSLSDTTRHGLFYALENSLDRLAVSDDELLLISFVLEGFLFQARAFLDFYMLYLCQLLRTGQEGSISKARFFKALARVDSGAFAEKAKWGADYFSTRVFGPSSGRGFAPENWGTLLESLRDKIAHRDRLRPSFDSSEKLIEKVLFDWPTLRGITYDRFCQDMQNGMFALFTDVSPVLYKLDWKPGPYRPDLWG